MFRILAVPATLLVPSWVHAQRTFVLEPELRIGSIDREGYTLTFVGVDDDRVETLRVDRVRF